MPFYLLNDDDRRKIQAAVTAVKKDVRTNRSQLPAPDTEAPGPYIALTPPEGISAPLGHADCEVYRIINDLLYAVAGLYRKVYNLGASDIPGNELIGILRDKYGSWFAVAPATVTGGQLPERDTGTGTGTGTEDDDEFTGTGGQIPGTGTRGQAGFDCSACPPVEFTSYRYRCENGSLNEYQITNSFSYDEDCCLSADPPLPGTSGEEFVRRVADCAGEETDTGTADEATGTSTAEEATGTSTSTAGEDTGTSTGGDLTTGTGTDDGSSVGCSGSLVPNQLTIILENISGCECLDGAEILVVHDLAGTWISANTTLCTVEGTLQVQCSETNWLFSGTGIGPTLASSFTEVPFMITFNNVTFTSGFCDGTVNVTVVP